MVPRALLALQAQVSTASHVLAQGWRGRAAPQGPRPQVLLVAPGFQAILVVRLMIGVGAASRPKDRRSWKSWLPGMFPPWVCEQAAGWGCPTGFTPPPPHRGPTSVGQVIC